MDAVRRRGGGFCSVTGYLRPTDMDDPGGWDNDTSMRPQRTGLLNLLQHEAGHLIVILQRERVLVTHGPHTVTHTFTQCHCLTQSHTLTQSHKQPHTDHTQPQTIDSRLQVHTQIHTQSHTLSLSHIQSHIDHTQLPTVTHTRRPNTVTHT